MAISLRETAATLLATPRTTTMTTKSTATPPGPLSACACFKKVLGPGAELCRADQVWPLRVWGGHHHDAAHGRSLVGGGHQSGEGVIHVLCPAARFGARSDGIHPPTEIGILMVLVVQ